MHRAATSQPSATATIAPSARTRLNVFERYHLSLWVAEATLDWLETTGVLVEQFDPFAAQNEVTKRPMVQHILVDKENGLCRSFWRTSQWSLGARTCRAQSF